MKSRFTERPAAKVRLRRDPAKSIDEWVIFPLITANRVI
jgi:hypothetical protein